MKIHPLFIASILAASPGLAEEAKSLDAHEHGVGQLNIAVDGQQIAMEFHAPGADIVGFEYEASSEEDLAAIEAAIEALEMPMELFGVPASAGCSVVEAHAGLESEEHHDDHDEEKHGDEDHDHEEEGHDDHDDHADHDDHDDHGEDKHDDHDDHDGHGEEDDHDEHEHAEEASHTEFHAEYLLNCEDPSKASELTFGYFETFPNALEVEVQIITSIGAKMFEVEREEPVLDLSEMF